MGEPKPKVKSLLGSKTYPHWPKKYKKLTSWGPKHLVKCLLWSWNVGLSGLSEAKTPFSDQNVHQSGLFRAITHAKKPSLEPKIVCLSAPLVVHFSMCLLEWQKPVLKWHLRGQNECWSAFFGSHNPCLRAIEVWKIEPPYGGAKTLGNVLTWEQNLSTLGQKCTKVPSWKPKHLVKCHSRAKIWAPVVFQRPKCTLKCLLVRHDTILGSNLCKSDLFGAKISSSKPKQVPKCPLWNHNMYQSAYSGGKTVVRKF